MAEQETGGTPATAEHDEQTQGFEAITSQEEFDKRIQARLARERAKFSDYDDMKAKADKFAELEESQKTEAQKAQERAEAAEKRAAEFELKATRAEVAAAKGVPADLLSGSTAKELEASAEALIAFRDERPKGPIVPGAGKTPTAEAPKTTADAFAQWSEENFN